ncbi:MAG: hypothetical protein E7558_00620 [Ruminococcaceae bacterium]|nr:hypothetical protein [Oscillospiraceae bacterium]
MPTFGEAERKIASLLYKGNTFNYRGDCFTILNSGKPTCMKGEPKTDIYVEAKSEYGDIIEIKITYKKENADFIENKTNAVRAKALFGDDWENIIMQATESIRDVFENKKLIYKSAAARTERGAITLGWKYELLNKTGGGLSGLVELTREQIIDVYAGTHISKDKRDARVNGVIIKNCGIANFILMNDSVKTTQEIIDSLYTIEDYVDMYPTVYFACKALNYRTFYNKYDGNRPLSVYVDWYVENGQLCHNLVFDSPLSVGGNEVADNLIVALNELGIDTTDDITADIVSDPSIINF